MNLSICLIYRQEDIEYLDEFLECLPPGCELIICKTEESINPLLLRFGEKVFMSSEKNGMTIKTGKYFYQKGRFSFAEARNMAIGQATRDWILSLDIDERVFITPSAWQMIVNQMDNVGACNTWVISEILGSENIAETDIVSCWQTRLFRNHHNIHYKYACHESISESFFGSGLTIASSGIVIRHLGYYSSPAKIAEKSLRNFKLLVNDLVDNYEERINDLYYLNKLTETLSGIIIMEKSKQGVIDGK